MSGIVFEQVTKNFDKTIVLQPASIEIQEGEFVVLVGPSGCGKTTFLRLIAGLEQVTSGNIKIAGNDVTWSEPKNRGVAMVFQNYALYPHMTVEENLQYPLNILKLPKDEKKQRINQVATLLDIEKLLNRRPAQLSGGQKQRVAIGRALVRKPQVFLFDEPLSNLDARLREQMRLEIAKLHQTLKRTTVYVTHDQHEAMTLGDRLVVMNEGRIVQVGHPLELYNNPQDIFVAKFLGNPPINTLEGKFTAEQQFEGTFGKIHIKPPETKETELTLAIRPDQITIHAPDDEVDCIGTVLRVEHLGMESHYHLKIQEIDFLAVTKIPQFQAGEKVGLKLVAEKALWYSSKTGKLQ
ncbi:MAG: ABC-type sugar transport system ATPase subunit [bacterium]|jgi:ABC-type sugar transport system ATPase subunit